jgi:hypothetical protein
MEYIKDRLKREESPPPSFAQVKAKLSRDSKHIDRKLIPQCTPAMQSFSARHKAHVRTYPSPSWEGIGSLTISILWQPH